MVQRTHGRTGRLPDWIVDQLEKSHLLRAEQRGGERWYELAHDRLAEPVGRQMDRIAKVISRFRGLPRLRKIKVERELMRDLKREEQVIVRIQKRCTRLARAA